MSAQTVEWGTCPHCANSTIRDVKDHVECTCGKRYARQASQSPLKTCPACGSTLTTSRRSAACNKCGKRRDALLVGGTPTTARTVASSSPIPSHDSPPPKNWFAHHKILAAITSIVLLSIIGAIAGTSEDREDRAGEPTAAPATAQTTHNATPPPTAPPTPAPTPIAPIVLSGRGKSATTKFDVQGGLAVFHMSHQGSSNFAPQLLNGETGETAELLANVIGRFAGSKATGLSRGSYLIDVEASGPWEIRIEQPRPVEAPAAPQTLTGNGQSVGGPIRLSGGLVQFALKHSGKSNFAVILIDSDGEKVELLANEIGPFDGSKATRASSSGIYWLDITADGAWSIIITQ